MIGLPSHRALQELQYRHAIPAFRGEDLEHLALVVNGTRQVVDLAADPDEHLRQMLEPYAEKPPRKVLKRLAGPQGLPGYRTP